MKKFLLLTGFILSLIAANCQNPDIVKNPEKFMQYVILPVYTTAGRPAPSLAMHLFNTDSSKEQYWNGSMWVTVGGSGTALSNGYGIILLGANITWDSAHVRKVDTLYRTNDSTLSYAINGVTRSLTLSGNVKSFNGRTGVITLTNADVIAALGYTPLPSNTTITVNGSTQNLNSSPVFSSYFVDSLKRSSDSVYARTNGSWRFQYIDSSGGGGGSGDSLLSQLKDVNVSSPSNLQILQFQTSDGKWHNNTLNFLQASNNLSDVASVSTARTNLGLATVASSGLFGDLSGFHTLTFGTGIVTGSFNGLSAIVINGDTNYFIPYGDTTGVGTNNIATRTYVTNAISGIGNTFYSGNGTFSGNRTVTGGGHSLTVNGLSALNLTVSGADGSSTVSTSSDTALSINAIDNPGNVSLFAATPHSAAMSTASPSNINFTKMQFLDTAAYFIINNNTGQSNNYILTLIDSASGRAKWMPSSGGGGTNVSVGSGYRWVVFGTSNVKSFFAVSPILLDSSSNANAITAKLDTTVVHTSAYNNATFQAAGSYVSAFSNTTITSGTSSTVTGGQQIITINPSSTLATYTLTLGGSPNNNDVIIIRAGGTITSGVVVTSFTLAGIAIIDPNQPTFLIAGQDYIIRFATPVTSYYPN